MKTFAGLAAGAAVLLAACATSPPSTAKSQEELAKTIAGRVAGEPVNCINQQRISSSHIIEGLAIVYTMSDRSMYVNRPTSGASSLRSNAVMVTDTHSGQLCDIDIVRLHDSATQMPSGSVGLGKFVPYSRSDRSRS